MIRIILAAGSFAMAVFMYVPQFRRILKRKHTRDFSKQFSWLVFLVQLNNFGLATAEHAPFLMSWYVLQSILCGAQLYFVYKFWDSPDPRFQLKRDAKGRFVSE